MRSVRLIFLKYMPYVKEFFHYVKLLISILITKIIENIYVQISNGVSSKKCRKGNGKKADGVIQREITEGTKQWMTVVEY